MSAHDAGIESRDIWKRGCAELSGSSVGSGYFGEVEPEVAVVVVLAEDEFAVSAGDGVAELVAVAALFENGSGDAEIGDGAGCGVAAEEIGHFGAAETEESAVGSYRDRSDRGEMRAT
jgi:hypothetical protein